MSANIGPGLLALPYALYHMGLIFGSLVIVFFGLVSHLSNMMYVKIKLLIPREVETNWEVGYVLFGRNSIFVLCFAFFFYSFSCMIISYIVICDTITTIVYNIIHHDEDKVVEDTFWTDMFTNKTTYVLIFGTLRLLTIHKTER